MNARDFIGLPVIYRIPSPPLEFFERVGTVVNASNDSHGVFVEVSMYGAREIFEDEASGFSIRFPSSDEVSQVQ